MLIIIFMFLLVISFAELLGIMDPAQRYCAFLVIFAFLIYQYQKIKQFGKEKLLSQEELKRTNEVIQALLTTTNINKLLSLIMDNLTRDKSFDSAFIYLIESSDNYLCIATKGAVALGGIKKFYLHLENQDKTIKQAVKSKLPLMVQDAEKNHLVDKEIISQLGLRQFIILPLVVQDKMLGIIIIGNSKTKINFSSKDLAISTTIANQAAVALQNAQLYSKIQELSILDELTQTFNHRFFQQKIKEEVELARRYESALSLAIIDIDFFKNYNDKNGHPAGDTCLRQVAQVISHNLRRTDIVARYGGEEFALILPATSKDGAGKILNKMRIDIERYPFEFAHNQPEGKLTVSAGISVYPIDAKESRELISLADQALYKAKNLGRNKVIICETIATPTPESI
ncbi:MAG: hypothetical protein A2539_06765 [Elusimicrobia bacterium RIFOXYD2_FULL_34_15]|nr:MAG: hypothetical protein A2539_06765 [Elusimicrobia bacterium RIFOXYD2_FULL_34_15]